MYDVCCSLCAGKICVPIDPSEVDSFNPFQVPTVSKICYEFETKGSKGTYTPVFTCTIGITCRYVNFRL